MGVSELLPCPFCGGKAKLSKFLNVVPRVSVGCASEECLVYPEIEADTVNAAIIAWNTRAALPHMQPAGEAVAKKHDPSLGPCQWPDCGHDTNQSDSTPGCLGAFCDATRKQATPPQPSAEEARATPPAPVDVRRAREVLSSWRVDAENDDHPDYTAEERAGIAAMADEMEAALFAQQPSADARDGERWRAMRENLVAVDFAPEIGGGPVVMFACHADRAHAGPTGADAIADAAIAAQREAQSA